jgi:hypothetical protein
MRRDHDKYLNLMSTIALLHQHQRELVHTTVDGERVEYVVVTLADVELCNRLSHQVLGRSLDELPPQTRRLLERISAYVKQRCDSEGAKRSEVLFTRRQLREATGLGDTQLKVHLSRLCDLELVVVRQGGPQKLTFYELLYDGEGDDGAPFVLGLVDAKTLRPCDYDRNWSGSLPNWSGANEHWSGAGRPLVGPRSGGGRGGEIADKLKKNGGLSTTNDAERSKRTSPVNARASYTKAVNKAVVHEDAAAAAAVTTSEAR